MSEYLDKIPMRAGKPSLSNCVRNWINHLLQPQGLISGLDQTKLAVLADSSHWTGKLTKDVIAGADIWSPKLTDGLQINPGAWDDLGNYHDSEADNTIQLCYEVGRPCVPFHFVQWNYTADQWNIDKIIDWQYKIIENALKGKTPHKSYHGFVLDCETLGCTDTNYASIVSGLYNRLYNAPFIDGMPLIIYTSSNVMNQYPAFKEWCAAPGTYRNLWMAQWVYTRAWSGDWAAFRSQVLPGIDLRVITPASWWSVQYTASCKVCGFGLDVSATTRTPEALYKWLNYNQTTPPPVPPSPTDNPDLTELTDAVNALTGRVDSIEAKLAAVKGAL